MNSHEKLSQFCVICLRDSTKYLNSDSFGNEQIKFRSFLKFFGSFVGIFKEKNSCDVHLSDLKCCDVCFSLVDEFTDFYDQYKCLELRLDFIVWKIKRIMKLANKVPSRVCQAKTGGLRKWESVSNYRENIIQSCQLKFEKSQPRVSLQKIMSPVPAFGQTALTGNSILDSQNENKTETTTTECVCFDNIEDETNDNDNDISEEVDWESSTEDVATKHEVSDTCISKSIAVSSSSSSSLAIGTILAPICKTEPTNDLQIQTENILRENEMNSTSITNTQLPTKQYSLRKKLPRKNIQQNNDGISDNEHVSRNNQKDASSNVSYSSFSETSSESSSSDEEEHFDNKPSKSSLGKIERIRKKYKAKYNHLRVFMCKSGKCKRNFRQKPIYENHLKLHVKGKFTCNFCSKKLPNLVLLCSHEIKMHGDQNSVKRNEWQCPRCPYKCTYLSDYEAHFAFTHFGVGVGPLNRRKFEKCKICNRDIWNKFKMSHFKACHDTSTLGDKKILTCEKDGCSAYFLQKWQLRYHHQMEHKIKVKKIPKPVKFQCSVCFTTFSKNITLQRHRRKSHGYRNYTSLSNQANQNDENKRDKAANTQVVKEQITVTQFKCNFCPTIKDDPYELAVHEAAEHAPENLTNLTTSKKTSCCPRCPFKYTLERSHVKHHLHVHMNILNPDSPSACKLCSGGKVYKADSERHFKNFHKIDDGMEPHKCDKCPAYFRKTLQLQMHHIRIHQQDHKCEVCGKYMKTRIGLKAHMIRSQRCNEENPDLPLGCDFLPGCKKRFRTQAELDHHKKYGHQRPGWAGPRKKNFGENFECGKCEKEFTCHTNLQAHLIKIHGDRPFVCGECGKGFGSKTILDMHLEFHKKPDEWKWQCEECGKKCATKQKLEVHRRMHTKEKPFICQFCGERYAHKQNWRNHVKLKHADEEGVEEMIGKQNKGNFMKRKGTKRGDCILANK